MMTVVPTAKHGSTEESSYLLGPYDRLLAFCVVAGTTAELALGNGTVSRIAYALAVGLILWQFPRPTTRLIRPRLSATALAYGVYLILPVTVTLLDLEARRPSRVLADLGTQIAFVICIVVLSTWSPARLSAFYGTVLRWLIVPSVGYSSYAALAGERRFEGIVIPLVAAFWTGTLGSGPFSRRSSRILLVVALLLAILSGSRGQVTEFALVAVVVAFLSVQLPRNVLRLAGAGVVVIVLSVAGLLAVGVDVREELRFGTTNAQSSDENRVLEARSALHEYVDHAGGSWLVGQGLGAEFDLERNRGGVTTLEEDRHIVHLGPIRTLTRYGPIALVFVGWLGYALLRGLFAVRRQPTAPVVTAVLAASLAYLANYLVGIPENEILAVVTVAVALSTADDARRSGPATSGTRNDGDPLRSAR